MSDLSVTVQAHPPERRARRSTVVYCGCCCCCCCCLHSVGALVGAGASMPAALHLAPRRAESVAGWFWGTLGVLTGVTFLASLGLSSSNLIVAALVVILGFPLIALAAGLVAMIGVAIPDRPERGKAVLA